MKEALRGMRYRTCLRLLILGVVLEIKAAERAGDSSAGNLQFEVSSRSSFTSKTAVRSSVILATDGVASHAATHGVASHAATATSSFAQVRQVLQVHSHMVGGEGGRAMMKLMASCVCLLIVFKLLSKIDCYGKRLDCRRCRLCGRMLLASGWDEFPGFKATVTIHSIADVVNTGMMGGEKLFKVKVAFKWSVFMSSSTADMRWEQTKGVEVPQGADECVITLLSEGKIKDTTIGEYVLETKKDMLDAKKFWNEKKKFKLENKGKIVGTLIITFRNVDGGDEGGGGGGELPIDGIDEDSALAIAIRESYEEMIKDGSIKPPEPPKAAAPPEGEEGEAPMAPAASEKPEVVKLEGNQKIDCLGRCITGPLREVDKDNKEAGKTFVRVINCNFAELQGDDMQKELKKQWEKAQSKGLSELPKKWYWVWYEDKKAAYHDKKWHEPDGFIPMTAISKVNRQPERNDQFVISYSQDGDKGKLVYRREGGKSLDVWFDGIDQCFNACREQVKAEKDGPKG